MKKNHKCYNLIAANGNAKEIGGIGMNLEKITINGMVMPRQEKLEVERAYYKKYKKPSHEIVVGKNNELYDGYISYLVLIENGRKRVNTVISPASTLEDYMALKKKEIPVYVYANLIEVETGRGIQVAKICSISSKKPAYPNKLKKVLKKKEMESEHTI